MCIFSSSLNFTAEFFYLVMVARHDKLRLRISSAIKEILIQLGENLAEVRLRGDFNKVEQWEGHLIGEKDRTARDVLKNSLSM